MADAVTLDPGEEVRWEGHPRLATVLPSALVGLVLLAVGVAVALRVSPAGLLLVPVGLAIPAVAYLQVVNTRYLVTNRAVYAKSGVLGRRVTSAELSRVQDSSFHQSIRGSLLGYGSVGLEIAGGNDIDFRNIHAPQEVRALVDRISGREELPGTIEQWTAVREELRALRAAIEEHGLPGR
ncbi:PH domain-containing protein [Natronomonas sp. EA1]|uniref:PH domain-containing protein n=1 Tax=Natronomonas sp. EA1 TaxID=3421655 RepID=UPI003EB9478A